MANGLLEIVPYGAADVCLDPARCFWRPTINTRFPRSARRGAAREWEDLVRLQIANKWSGGGIDVRFEIDEASAAAKNMPELPPWLFKARKADRRRLEALYRVITGEQPIMYHDDVKLQLRLGYQAVAFISILLSWAWQKILGHSQKHA